MPSGRAQTASGMITRVTQSDVARAAGVHNTTVSLALRNSPAIPEATRRRIQSIAEQMGYCPDPALQALVAYRNGRMANRRPQTIAYLTNGDSRLGWKQIPAQAKVHQGAHARAAQLGFQLEPFWLREPGISVRRLGAMLFHRGITGVLLASCVEDVGGLDELDWSRLCAVKIGCFPRSPALHRVSFDQCGAMRQAVKRATAAGYRRIGLVLPSGWDAAADQAWSAGFFVEQSRIDPALRLPALLYTPAGNSAHGAAPVEPAVLEEWIRSYGPEVIISSARFVLAPLKRLGRSVPRDVGFADLFLDGSDPALSGMRENCERVGEVAAELLVNQLQQNHSGIPAIATSTLVEGTWHDGLTLPTRSVAGWSAEPCATGAADRPILVSVA